MRVPFRKAQLYLRILMTLEIFTGLAIILLTIVYQHQMSAFLADMEGKVVGGQFLNVYIFGIQLVLVYVTGINVWNRLWQQKYTATVELFIAAWMFLTFLIIVSGIGTIWSLYRCANAMQSTTEMSLRKGIDLYFESPEWKLLWDGLQFHKQCCGVLSYKDWMKATWMPQEKPNIMLDKDLDCFDNIDNIDKIYYMDTTKRTRRSFESNYSILAPYACCKQSSTQCYESYMPRTDSNHNNIPTLDESEINTNGCLPIFTQKMGELLNLLGLCVLISFILNVLICFLSKCVMCKQTPLCGTSSDMSFVDEEGRPVIYLKCPANVSCVTVNETPGKTEKNKTQCCEFCGKLKNPAELQQEREQPLDDTCRNVKFSPCRCKRTCKPRILH